MLPIEKQALKEALRIRIDAELHRWTCERLQQLLLADQLGSYPVKRLVEEIAERRTQIEIRFTAIRELLELEDTSDGS